MKLYSLKIEGYKRLKNVNVSFGKATFLIGENNIGKSSILKAIELLLSSKTDKLIDHDYSMLFNEDKNENVIQVDKVVLTAEFRDVSEDILQFQGFNKSRLLDYIKEEDEKDESGKKIVYRKTYKYNEKATFEMLTYKKSLKEKYKDCKKPIDYVNCGVNEESMKRLFSDTYEKNISATKKSILDDIDELWNIEDEEIWDNNPGGFASNILSKLPKFILIPAIDKADEITSNNGALKEIMNELFNDVREQSDNYKQAQKYLTKLEDELNPQDEESEFGKLMGELNSTLDSVFPTSKIHTKADLSEPDKVLKPNFDIQMSSNIVSPVSHQGTGMIRTVVFSLLKFRETWKQKKKEEFERSLIIGFEEPEIYLHPNAANQMRNTIYDLVSNSTQIVCSTHSPYMIDLSKKPNQILNNLLIENDFVKISAFNISKEFKKLHDDDKSYVKMLQRIDDYIARMFFAKKVYIVEGDTDELVLKRTIELLPEKNRAKALSEVQIIKARGKASIISLVKYIKSMDIPFFVIHDRDNGTEGATKFNKPILDAIGSEANRLMMEECIEDELGYSPPSSNKPYRAFDFTNKWKKWDDIPENWKNKMKIVFSDYIN